MKYYTRTTHNFNNETREWEPNNNLKPCDFTCKTILGIQGMSACGEWISLSQLYQNNKKYFSEWNPTEYRNSINPPKYNIESCLWDLEQFEKIGWVKSKEN